MKYKLIFFYLTDGNWRLATGYFAIKIRDIELIIAKLTEK